MSLQDSLLNKALTPKMHLVVKTTAINLDGLVDNHLAERFTESDGPVYFIFTFTGGKLPSLVCSGTYNRISELPRHASHVDVEFVTHVHSLCSLGEGIDVHSWIKENLP